MIGGTRLKTIVEDPEHARFICDELADCASFGPFKKKASYQVLRSLSPEELFELYQIRCKQNTDAFRKAFGPVYHRVRGEELPLFRGMEC